MQRVVNDRSIFLDDMAIYGAMPPLRMHVTSEHHPFIIVDKRAAYADCFDFIGAINGSRLIESLGIIRIKTKILNSVFIRSRPFSFD